jgi:hypothetical protein
MENPECAEGEKEKADNGHQRDADNTDTGDQGIAAIR